MSREGDDFKETLWAYRAVFTQTNAGGGSIQANIVANERTLILYGLIGPDDYAANRNVEGFITDSADNLIGRALFGSPIDNGLVPFPVDAGAAVAGSSGNQFFNRFLLAKGEKLKLKGASLVQNETLTVSVRALVQNVPPTISTTGSGGTVTTTVTYDKVL